MELASVATAFAKYDLPVPGGYRHERKIRTRLKNTPYNKIPLQGVRLPVNRCGNFIGKMTASFNASLAASKPATSLQWTFGFSVKIAPANADRSFLISASSFLLDLESSESESSVSDVFLLPLPPTKNK